MPQLLRMLKENRSILVIPFSVCMVFILLQCMVLQRHSVHTPPSIRTYIGEDGEWRHRDEEARHLRNERKSLWEEVSKTVADSDAGRADDDGTTTSFGVEETSGDWRVEESEEELERLRHSPYIYHEEEEKKRLESPVVQKELKYISYYQPFDATQKSFKLCRYNMCSYAESLSQADVIAFKAALIRDHGIPKFHRPKGQRWVMFTSDPASKNYNLQSPEMKSQFNATCTYRLDSDIKWTFGKLREVRTPPLDYDKIYDSKEGTVAWYVSHCRTFGRREEYVRRMQTVLNIDVYGLCSNHSCGDYNHRKDDNTSCLPMLSRKYKFYLSFENSFCEDYVTEKFFKLFKKVNVIPVVRGGVEYRKLFPSGVYINAADFNSPEKLAKYLLDLGNDKRRYLQMLRKKSSWVFMPGGEMKHCMLCEYAHTETTPKYYPNIRDVFNGDYPHCWKPTDI